MNDNHGFHFSESDVKKVLSSAAGKQLLQLLNQDGGKRLQQAADALKNRNPEEAQRLLSPVMNSEEAAGLIQKLNRE